MPASEQRTGLAFALAAYVFWGVAPIYFKLLGFATPLEIIAHRVLWAMVVMVLLIAVRGQFPAVARLSGRQLAWLALSGALVSVNWLVFVWALLNDRMMEASLGYYINPLFTVLLGGVFLKEWLRPPQLVAVALATVGVLNEVISVGVVPWAGLSLAVTFGFYGLVRKRLALDSAVGLGVETTLMLPIAVGYLIYLGLAGRGALAAGDAGDIALLAAGGLVTVFPLVCFAAAALRLRLVVLGFMQYLAPSITLLLAIFVYHEPFRLGQLVTFGFIWAALVIFSLEALYYQRRLARRLPGQLSRGGLL